MWFRPSVWLLCLLYLLPAKSSPAQSVPLALSNTGDSGQYNLISTPSGPSGVTVFSPIPSNYVIPNDSTSSWIRPDGYFLGVGNYAYRTTFDLAGLDPNTAVIEGLWSTDNAGVDILINGVSTGNTTSDVQFNIGFKAFTISDGFVDGINTLDFVVHDTGVVTALNVRLTGSANVAPPTDSSPPIITIASPSMTTCVLNQSVQAQYSATDSGSGVTSVVGTVANGATIDTASIGSKTFTVTATDNAGNTATQTVNYTVGYGICVLYDQSKAHKSGSTIPIKIQLCDANGANYSSAGTVVTATGVLQVSANAPGPLEDSGNANPDFNFRYDAALQGYIFNLKTTGYATGTYRLFFTAGSDPTQHSVEFQIK